MKVREVLGGRSASSAEAGATCVEYLLLLSLLFYIALAAAATVGRQSSESYRQVACAFNSEEVYGLGGGTEGTLNTTGSVMPIRLSCQSND